MGRRLVWRLSADLVELPERENAVQLLNADDDNHQDSIEAAAIA